MFRQATGGDVSASAQGTEGREIPAIIRALSQATSGITAPQGIVLVVSRPGLPRATGWFHAHVPPGFSASAFSILQDAIETIPGSAARQESVSAMPRATWRGVRITSRRGNVGDLWLYQPPASTRPSKSEPKWSDPAGSLNPILEHLNRWSEQPPDVNELLSLHPFARALNAAVDLEQIGTVTVDAFTSMFGAASVSLALLNDAGQLETVARVGSNPLLDGTNVSPAERSDNSSERNAAEWFFDLMPLSPASGKPLGAVTCYWEGSRRGEVVNLPLRALLIEQLTAAIERTLAFRRTQVLGWSAASALVDAVDARDSYTRHHALRVARYSRQIAELLELPRDEVKVVETAGLLHDVGKIGIPDRVLQSSGKLEADDWDLIRRHPEIGASIAGAFAPLAEVVPMIRHHHERYDGTGYPSGLTGDAIPLGARIIAVVEAFDTLVTGRPYQSPWTIGRALEAIETLGSSQFDEDVVRLFCAGVRDGTIRIDIPPPVKTGELDLHRWVGAEARAFGLLQRIGNEVGELIEITRFLKRLKEIIETEFSDSFVEIFIRDREEGRFIAVPDESPPPHRQHQGVYVMTPDRGIVGWVVSHQQLLNVADVQRDARYVAPGGQPMRSELAVPMLLNDACVGVLNLESPHASAYSRTDEKVLETIASYVARALQVAELHSQVKLQSDIDSMTGLLNHRAFYQTLEAEVDRATRMDDLVSVAIIDVDDFKRINDSKGHIWGDAVIRRLAGILSRSVRQGDAVARYGGDEFAIIMPGASRDIIQRRMLAIEQELRQDSENGPLPVISWGIASFPDDGARPTELVAQADAAMYALKQRSQS